MEISKVYFLTENEKEEFYQGIRKRTDYRNTFSIRWCKENTELIKKLHDQFYYDFQKIHYDKYYEHEVKVIESKKYANSVFEKLENNQKVKCVCGADLRIVPDYNFVGCTNYLSPGKHNNFNYYPDIPDKPMEFESFHHPIGVKYISTLKKMYDLPDRLKVSIMADYIINVMNIEPYADIKITNYFVGGVNSNISRKQEKILKLYLEDFFNTVNYQPIIRVTFVDGSTRLIIPDFIVSNNEKVIVVEAKKSKHLEDVNKLDLYRSAVEYFMKEHKDGRDLKAITVFHDTSDYNKIKEL